MVAIFNVILFVILVSLKFPEIFYLSLKKRSFLKYSGYTLSNKLLHLYLLSCLPYVCMGLFSASHSCTLLAAAHVDMLEVAILKFLEDDCVL